MEQSGRERGSGPSATLVIMAVAHVLVVPHVLAVWIGIPGIPYGAIWLAWPKVFLPLIALSLAIGGAGVIAMLKWRKWGACALAASWLMFWALLLLNFPSLQFVVSGLFAVVGYVLLVRPIWRFLN